MSFVKRIVCVSLIAGVALVSGCIESQPINRARPFEVQELDACLAIVVDMSGSFAESWDDKAYDLFLELMDRFFVEGMGQESRVIIAQLSGNSEVVIFEGTPSELRQRFQNPDALNQFLRDRSNPDGSQVYQSARKTIDYISSLPGISERTKLLTVILSDLADTESDLQARRTEGYAMLESLKRYQQQGGGLALYFVSQEETDRWRRILAEAGFEPGQYVIENTLVENPRLPRLD